MKFYREVELKHGRVAMLASLGFLVGEHLNSNPDPHPSPAPYPYPKLGHSGEHLDPNPNPNQASSSIRSSAATSTCHSPSNP